jgi:hypothetical protein
MMAMTVVTIQPDVGRQARVRPRTTLSAANTLVSVWASFARTLS